MAVKYTKPRGTADVLPSESGVWVNLEEQLRKIVSLYGYKEIRLPTFESTEVFSRGVGDTTDIVGKEMYTFLDKKERSITLRPEGTSGVARAVLENGLLGNSPLPLKMYYLQSCFRYEKAQKGRLREFHQLGIECFGTNAPQSDAMVINVGAHILSEMGLQNVELEINSIGCKVCRAKYNEALKSFFEARADALCETCGERLTKNPMRILDCKNEKCAQIAKDAPVMLDYLCEECTEHFDKVKTELDALELQYTVNPTIVRGLDYYSNTVFEFIHRAVGTQGTICGGGRYNGLIEQFGGTSTPAVGFGMGIERLLLALAEENVLPNGNEPPDIYIANLGDAALIKALQLTVMCAKHKVRAECDMQGRGLKPQMKYADKLGARYSIVLGEDEIQKNEAQLKNMTTGEVKTVTLNESLAAAVKG